MAQVKFYAVETMPSTGVDAGGLYFVQDGEIYKGSERFGLGRVTTVASLEAAQAIEGAKRCDIAVTGSGAAWVYDGTAWKAVGGDISSLQASWRADISTWTAGLVQNGAGSYITGITQGADGKVTASASNFESDVKTAVGNGSASATANGITVEVTTTSGKVTDVSVSASQITCDAVTASTATFTNLTVSNTATFTATVVSANSLTIAGNTVNQIAQSEIAAATLSGSIASSSGTSLVNEGQVVNYVSAQLQSAALVWLAADGSPIA